MATCAFGCANENAHYHIAASEREQRSVPLGVTSQWHLCIVRINTDLPRSMDNAVLATSAESVRLEPHHTTQNPASDERLRQPGDPNRPYKPARTTRTKSRDGQNRVGKRYQCAARRGVELNYEIRNSEYRSPSDITRHAAMDLHGKMQSDVAHCARVLATSAKARASSRTTDTTCDAACAGGSMAKCAWRIANT